MRIQAESIDDYLTKIPENRREVMLQLLGTIRKNLPVGFSESIQYDMPSWGISLEDYPSGYHCTPNTPLPFLSVASQKNFIALYHMGIYAKPELLDWFTSEFPKYSSKKLDMGKSCIRFKNPQDIPFSLIAELCQKMTPQDWITTYEALYKK